MLSAQAIELTGPQGVDNPWAFLAAIVTTGLTISYGIWSATLTRRKDQEERGAINHNKTLAFLLEANRDKSERLEALERITELKYPAALDHIVIVHRVFPTVRESIPIPRVLFEDIEEKKHECDEEP